MGRPSQTTAVAETATTTERDIYRAGPVEEDVVLVNIGDTLGDITFSISLQGGKVASNAPLLPRFVPVPIRLAPNSIISVVSTSGERDVMVIATARDSEHSSEEELYNLRCLMERLVALMTTFVDRMPIK